MAKIDFEINDPTLSFNVADLFANMDTEAKGELVRLFAWYSPIWEEIKDGVNSEYAAEHFNDTIYRLRLSFLQSEDAADAIRQTVRSLVDALKYARQEKAHYEELDRKWREWYRKTPHFEYNYPVEFDHFEREYLTHDEFVSILEKLGLTQDVLNNPAKGDNNEHPD